MIKAVIFDFDGVIADTMEDNFLAWEAAFNYYNYQINKLDYFKLEGMGRYQIAKHFISKSELPNILIDELVEFKEKYYLEHNKFRIYSLIDEIFSVIKSKNISIAVVTGASKARINLLLDNKYLRDISVIITSDDVLNTKPDSEPYLKAINLLNLNPDNCLVIENAILGILSAKSAGCKCFALETTMEKDYLQSADEIFLNHNKLLTRLIEIL